MTKSEKTKLYNRTKRGVSRRFYNHQLERCKTRGHVPPTYSREDLETWLMSQDKFHLLFAEWEASGFLKHLKPSVDRLDDTLSYTFDNIQLLTWEENNAKAREDIKSGKLSKGTQTVYQYSKALEYIATYPSIAIAARSVNGNRKAISECLGGRAKSSKGFVWKKHKLMNESSSQSITKNTKGTTWKKLSTTYGQP